MVVSESKSLCLQGSIVALVTPMFDNGEIDFPTLRQLIDWHLEQGTNGIVSVGTTGESPTLTVPEHLEVIRATVEQVAGRIPVIAGTGANSTSEAITLTTKAEMLGADASLQVVPYYNKPTQEGLFRHFEAIAASTKLPIVLYNVPGRTVADLKNETVVRLAMIDNIVGIKDATGDIARGKDLIARVPEGFSVLSGDDETAIELMLAGAMGDISVTANLVPKKMAKLCELALKKNVSEATALDATLQPLHSGLFVEPNPIAPKWALHTMGMIPSGIRLPMLPLSANAQAPLTDILEKLELLP